MKLYHFIRPEHVSKVVSKGYIDIEGCNQGPMPDNSYRGKLPPLAWFTTQQYCNTASASGITYVDPKDFSIERIKYNTVFAFTFDSDNINAVSWVRYRNKFQFHNKTMRYIKGLDATARKMGDNPDDFYVVEGRVPVTVDTTLIKFNYTGDDYHDPLVVHQGMPHLADAFKTLLNAF